MTEKNSVSQARTDRLQNRPWHACCCSRDAKWHTHTIAHTDSPSLGRGRKSTKYTHWSPSRRAGAWRLLGRATSRGPTAGRAPLASERAASEPVDYKRRRRRRRRWRKTPTTERDSEREIRAPVLIGHAVNWLEHTRARFGKNTSNSQ